MTQYNYGIVTATNNQIAVVINLAARPTLIQIAGTPELKYPYPLVVCSRTLRHPTCCDIYAITIFNQTGCDVFNK